MDIVRRPGEEFMGDGQTERGLAQFAVGEEDNGLLVHLRCGELEMEEVRMGTTRGRKKTKKQGKTVNKETSIQYCILNFWGIRIYTKNPQSYHTIRIINGH